MTPTIILFAVALATFAGALAEHKATQAIAQHRKLKLNQRKPAHK